MAATENPPPSRQRAAHLWGGIAAACIVAGILSAILFAESGIEAGILLCLLAIGPAIAFFFFRRPLHLYQYSIDVPLKDGTKVTVNCEWFPHPESGSFVTRSFTNRINEKMVHQPLDTVDPARIRQWIGEAVAGFLDEWHFSVFRFQIIGLTDPRGTSGGGIIIGEYDR